MRAKTLKRAGTGFAREAPENAKKEVIYPLKLSNELYIMICTVVAVLGGMIGFLLRKRFSEARIVTAKEAARHIIEEAEKEADILKKEALLQTKDKFYQEKADFEKETVEKRQELQNLEKRILQKESHLDKKVELIETKENEVLRKERALAQQEKNVVE